MWALFHFSLGQSSAWKTLSLCPDITGLVSHVGQPHVCDLGQVTDFLSLSSSSHSPPYRKSKYEDSKTQCLLPSVLMKLCTTSHWYMGIHKVVFGVICCSFHMVWMRTPKVHVLETRPPKWPRWEEMKSPGASVLEMAVIESTTDLYPSTDYFSHNLYDAFHHAKTQPRGPKGPSTESREDHFAWDPQCAKLT